MRQRFALGALKVARLLGLKPGLQRQRMMHQRDQRISIAQFPRHGDAPQRRLVVDLQAPIADPTQSNADAQAPDVTLPPNEAVIRALLGLKLYDQALDELNYAQKIWGDTPAIVPNQRLH